MAYDWQYGLKERFVRRIRKLLVFIAAGDGVILLGTWLLGIPVLNLFSGLELDAYLADLLILVAGGAFTAAAALLFQAITIMRRQTVAFGIYIVVTAVSAALVFFCTPFELVVRQTLCIVCFAPLSSLAPIYTDRCHGDTALASFTNSVSIAVSLVIMLALGLGFVL